MKVIMSEIPIPKTPRTDFLLHLQLVSRMETNGTEPKKKKEDEGVTSVFVSRKSQSVHKKIYPCTGVPFSSKLHLSIDLRVEEDTEQII